LKVVSSSQVEETLAILFLAVHHTVVKVPPRMTCPPVCRATLLTVPLALGLKVVSSSQVEETLAILFLAVHPTLVKVPQRIT
jgi:hypothetical protein